PVVSVEDLLFEEDESFRLDVSSVTGASPAALVAIGTILDDEVAPSLSIDDIAINEGETGTFTVTLSAVSGLDTVFTFASADGLNVDPNDNAVAPNDYTALASTTVTI